MEEVKMAKIITDLHNDVNDLHDQWDRGKLRSIEAIKLIKNLVKYLIAEFIG